MTIKNTTGITLYQPVPNYHLKVAREDGKEDEEYYKDAKDITTSDRNFLRNPLGYMIKLSATNNFQYNPIGAKVLYTNYTKEIKAALFQSRKLKEFMAERAKMNLKEKGILYPDQNSIARRLKDQSELKRYNRLLEKELKSIKDQARNHINGMMAEMTSESFVKFCAIFVNNGLVRMFNQGIHIKESEFLEVKKVALQCEKQKLPILFLPCHKSHIDYLVISYLFYRLGLSLPHIAAGDNLNLPIIGYILKHGGAFFLRRKFGNDPLYQLVFKEYVELLLQRGHNVEVFIEGTRSRVGKLLTPRFGMLKIALDSILSGNVKDVIMVPMSIDYDKVIETETYVTELLGKPKEKESLFGLLNNFNLLSLKLGRIDIRFSKPFSLQEWINSQISNRSTSESVFSPASNISHKNTLLQSLGYRVLSEINKVSVIMPPALVGTVLLTLRGRGVGREELIRRVTWLRREIIVKGGRVADFGGHSVREVVDRAGVALQPLVGINQDLLEPVFFVQKRFELSFYRNQVMHLFIHEALLCTAMYATIKKGQAHRTITRETLLQNVTFLSRLLKNEFIFKPGSIDLNLDEAISTLAEHEVLEVERDHDGILNVRLSDKERKIGRENYDFYCFLVWPFIETYWLAAASLFCIVPTPSVGGLTESALMKRVQHFGKTLYFVGDLGYFESVNKEILRNALRSYEALGLLKKKIWRKPVVKGNADLLAENPISTEIELYFVDMKYESEAAKILRGKNFNEEQKTTNSVLPEESDLFSDIYNTRLWEFAEVIGKFRREGKHRRDNEVTGMRVLRFARLAKMVSGEDEFEAKL